MTTHGHRAARSRAVPELRLYDVNFAGDPGCSRYHPPTAFAWRRGGALTPATFYTDQRLGDAAAAPAGVVRVAWLIEPREIDPAPYAFVAPGAPGRSLFDLVLTHDAGLARTGDPCAAYPCGMSWVAAADWDREHAKTAPGVSIIASAKRSATGHRLRHALIDRLRDTPDALDVFGRGYRPVEHKIEALGPYRFSVVIENCSSPWFFTEKLVDACAARTVPIYWGCGEVGRFFDPRGMLLADSLEALAAQVARAVVGGAALYAAMLPYARANHAAARAFACPEDWIARNVLAPNGLL